MVGEALLPLLEPVGLLEDELPPLGEVLVGEEPPLVVPLGELPPVVEAPPVTEALVLPFKQLRSLPDWTVTMSEKA